jgi:hypothetical protein
MIVRLSCLEYGIISFEVAPAKLLYLGACTLQIKERFLPSCLLLSLELNTNTKPVVGSLWLLLLQRSKSYPVVHNS